MVLDGTDLILSVGGKALAFSTGCKISTSAETGERVTKEAVSGKWKEKFVKSYSEQIAGSIDEEVKNLIDKAYRQCEQILTQDKEKLQQVVDFLMANETMSGIQFADCMEGREISESSKVSLFDGFKEKTEE